MGCARSCLYRDGFERLSKPLRNRKKDCWFGTDRTDGGSDCVPRRDASARKPNHHLRGPCPGCHSDRRYVISSETTRLRRGRKNRIRRKLFPPRHWFDLTLDDLYP